MEHEHVEEEFDDLLPALSRVRISKESEHYAGKVVYIIDKMPGEEFAYCVSTHRSTNTISECEWVHRDHVTEYKQGGRRVKSRIAGRDYMPLLLEGKSVLSLAIAAKKGLEEIRQELMNMWETLPIYSALPGSKTPVIVADPENYTVPVEVGFVVAMEKSPDGMVAVAGKGEGVPPTWYLKRFVRPVVLPSV